MTLTLFDSPPSPTNAESPSQLLSPVPEPQPTTQPAAALANATVPEIETLVRSCELCQLHCSRRFAVPGEGDQNASIMFIGEAPGAHEDQQGRPFVGPAGQLLDELLDDADLPRSQVYITNRVKCRPPGNRVPTPEEVSTCLPYLTAQIAAIKPDLIVPVGQTSLDMFLSKTRISVAAGRVHKTPGGFIYPIVHPAAALRSGAMRASLLRSFNSIPGIAQLLREQSDPPA